MLPETASALTALSGFGFQPGRAAPIASIAATDSRLVPPTWLNDPPTYSPEAETARARTGPLAAALKVVAFPSATPIAARALRRRPPIEVKSPPAYTSGPDTAKAKTPAFAPGFHAVGTPVAASM